jgi:hypothetical protein
VRTGTPRRLTAIGMIASHMSFRWFVRAARSTRRGKPAAGAPLASTDLGGAITCIVDDERGFVVGSTGASALGPP